MARLALSLLGPLQVTLAGTPVISFESDKVRALLFYLAVEADRAHRREALAGLLWPDQPERAARHSLSQALFNLRQVLADHRSEPPFFVIARETIQFNRAAEHWLDTADFSALLAMCDQHRHSHPCASCARRLGQAVDLYRGSFLQQFSVGGSTTFEEWAILKRERFHHQAIEALAQLAGHYERHGAYPQARQYAWRQLELDPWREEAHRQVMHLLWIAGQRSAALAQYEACRRILAQELGIEPEQETVALYERIQAGEPTATVEHVALPFGHLHNLPPQPTSFIGRDGELRDLGELLDNPACRLVTIVGPGGIGKTRLAMEAAEQAHAFADGVFFVPLAALPSGEFLASAIADVLRLKRQGQEDPNEQLVAGLRNKELLLVLDNFEHLLEHAGLLVDILQNTAAVKLLVTSRERLSLQWEWLFDVEGLEYPSGASADDLAGYSAVQLFTQRARRVQRSFSLASQNKHAVARICRVVAGMPLGIELAAASVRERSCEEIARQIASNLDGLATSLRDVPARHRSLRAVFDHSWSLLSAAEQRALAHLSVFRGGFGGIAAEVVANASQPFLTAVINKSLVRSDGLEQGHRRYDMHEIVRQYAFEQLHAAGEVAQVRDRHHCFFLDLAEQAEPHLTAAEQGHWLRRLEAEDDNIRAALEWSLERGWAEQAARLSGALWRFWTATGRLDEGRRWLERVLAPDVSLPPAVRAKALVGAGMLAWGQGEYARAVAACEQSLALYQELDDGDGVAACLQYLGSVVLHQGDYARSAALLEASLTLRREQGDRRGIALCLANLGALAGRQGASAQAERFYEESLILLREIGDKERIAVMLDNLGAVARDRGDYERARALYGEGLALLRELNNKWNIPTCLNNLGGIALDQGDYPRARALYVESLPLLQELGDKEGLAACLEGLAGVAGESGQPARAARLYGGAETLRARIGSPLSPVARARYERLVAAARAQVSQEAFTAAWNQGRMMALDQAVAFALSHAAE